MLGSASSPRPRTTNFELWSWLFMRVSGALLLILLLIHLAIMHVTQPIENVNFAFVAARWASPLWRWYDLVLLGLGWVHGLNGVRVVMDDWIHSPGWRLTLTALLWLIGFILLVIGAQVIFSFQAPAGAG
ncbi:MAG: succinate dehydrogenase [Chloroflexi bacterium]|nr:succinate dehydrogenase [Chloroflexota bacterium]MCL5108362.1 succinate dehydrogenase [Chloroflexota bacterium]